SDLQKVLSLGPQKVDASAAHLANFNRRVDERDVDIKKYFTQFHHRVVHSKFGVRLRWLAVVLVVVADIANAFNLAPVLPDFSPGLALVLTDAVATAY